MEVTAAAADSLEEIQAIEGSQNAEGIQVDDLDGSPDDEMQIQTGAESLFDVGGTDFSQYDHEPDDEQER